MLNFTANSQVTAHCPVVSGELLPEAAHASSSAQEARSTDGDSERGIDQWRLVDRIVNRVFDQHR